AIKAGRVVVTTAPEITLTAIDPSTGAESPIGSLVAPDAAGTVRVRVQVKAAPWVEVSRARLLLPGGESVVLPVEPLGDGVTRVDGNGDGLWGRPRASRALPGPQSKPVSHEPRSLDLRAMYRDWMGH